MSGSRLLRRPVGSGDQDANAGVAHRVLVDLLAAQNPDGGWGGESGRRSNTEATALAVAALGAQPDRSVAGRTASGLAWLVERQNPDGSWPLTADSPEGSWSTGLASLALYGSDAHRERALGGLRWLLTQESRSLGWVSSVVYRVRPAALPIRLNPDLKGWSWAPETFAWVEPTAYALIALKKARKHLQIPRLDERIRQGELMLYDRMCKGGGWNYGNSEVFGVDVPPYPEVTALALIALQDHQGAEANQRSLAALRRMLDEVESGFALSCGALCFSVYSLDPAALRRRLARSYDRTGFLGATRIRALALLALSDQAELFRIGPR